MKKLFNSKILLILLLSLFATAASAYDIEVANADGVTIYYNWINNNTELKVTYQRDDGWWGYYSEYSDKIVIPQSVKYNGNTYKVTFIGDHAFSACKGLTSITIPNSVTSIGEDAFYGCSGLTSITIPNSVTSIGPDAFSSCSGLTSITIPNSVTSIGNHALYYCPALSSISVESGNTTYDSRDNCNAIIETKSNTLIAGCMNTVIPNSVTSIGSDAFLGCSGLTSVTIPNSVSSIGEKSFWCCSGLTSVNLPNSVLSIGVEAFCGCEGLLYVTIPNSVTFIGNGAFYNCRGLKTVTSEIINPFKINDDVFLTEGVDNDIYPETLIVPTGTKAKYQSTDGWKQFKNIVEASGGSSEISKKQTIHVATAGTLPDLISESAREVIEDLTLTGEINGTDLKLIREMAGCPYQRGMENRTGGNLTVLDISGVKIKAGGDIYYVEYGAVDDYDIHNNDELPSHAFRDSKLTSFKAPSSVKSIGDCAFYGCSSLSNISNLSSVTSVGNSAFAYCTSLPLVAIPSNVKTIGDGAFVYCTGITSVSFSKSVTSISNSAFKGCSHLTSIYFPNMVTSIGSGAFSECTSLTTITSEIESPSSFDDSVFSSATYSNATLTVPKGKKSLYQSTAGWKNFKNIVEAGGSEIQKKRTIHVAKAGTLSDYISEEEKYQIEELTLTGEINGEDLRILRVMAGKDYVGDDGIDVNCIFTMNTDGRLSFLDMSEVKIVAGDFYAVIEEQTGQHPYYYYLEKDNCLPFGVFSDCTKLKTVILPNNLISIDIGAFSGCSGLISIAIPNSVTSIGDWAFEACSGLTSIKVESGNEEYDSRNNCNAIIETNSNTLIVGCMNTIITNDVTSIGSYAFYGCSGLTSVTIPNSVKSIGGSAFLYCSGLTSVTIPNSVTSIGSSAFSNTPWYDNQPDGAVYAGKVFYKYKGTMPDGTKISIVEGTLGIAGQAFSGCSGLTSITIPNSVTSIGEYAFYGTPWYDNQPDGAVYAGKVFYMYKGKMPDRTKISIEDGTLGIAGGAFYARDGLASVTIPNSMTSIGERAFEACSGLTSVISEIQNPFKIDDNVFYSYDPDIYATATLAVPAGTKAKYQSTDGWKLFQNIVEAAGDEIEFTIDGVTYQGYKSDKVVTVKAVNTSLNSVEIPASVSYDGTTYTVTGIAENAFVGCTMAALVWDVDNALPSNAFSDTEIGANFLLYVKDASYAPSTVRNVVVDGKASSITLSDDGGQLYCPKSFTANTISFTHNYNMETGENGKGWETIVLPFDVQTIKHRINGEIVPFAAYSQNSGKKPFWLCSFGNNGFVRASNIKANTPYIIAMPNQSNYSSSYVLAGDVTFSAENVTVAATPTFSGTFFPTFSTVPKASDVYALNVVNRYVSQTGGYDAGSKFISNLRDVRPFEAYISQASSTRGIYDVNMEDGTTSMDGVLSLLDPDREIDIYTLSGQKIKRVKQCDLNDIIDQLPHGVYIVNGQKVLH